MYQGNWQQQWPGDGSFRMPMQQTFVSSGMGQNSRMAWQNQQQQQFRFGSNSQGMNNWQLSGNQNPTHNIPPLMGTSFASGVPVNETGSQNIALRCEIGNLQEKDPKSEASASCTNEQGDNEDKKMMAPQNPEEEARLNQLKQQAQQWQAAQVQWQQYQQQMYQQAYQQYPFQLQMMQSQQSSQMVPEMQQQINSQIQPGIQQQQQQQQLNSQQHNMATQGQGSVGVQSIPSKNQMSFQHSERAYNSSMDNRSSQKQLPQQQQFHNLPRQFNNENDQRKMGNQQGFISNNQHQQRKEAFTQQRESFRPNMPSQSESLPRTTLSQKLDKNTSEVSQPSKMNAAACEDDYERQFRLWDQQYQSWREENKNNPDRASYHQYEQQYQQMRRQLLERIEHMKQLKEQARQQHLKANYTSMSHDPKMGNQGVSSSGNPNQPVHGREPMLQPLFSNTLPNVHGSHGPSVNSTSDGFQNLKDSHEHVSSSTHKLSEMSSKQSNFGKQIYDEKIDRRQQNKEIKNIEPCTGPEKLVKIDQAVNKIVAVKEPLDKVSLKDSTDVAHNSDIKSKVTANDHRNQQTALKQNAGYTKDSGMIKLNKTNEISNDSELNTDKLKRFDNLTFKPIDKNQVSISTTESKNKIVPLSERPKVIVINDCEIATSVDQLIRKVFDKKAIASLLGIYKDLCFLTDNEDALITKTLEDLKTINTLRHQQKKLEHLTKLQELTDLGSKSDTENIKNAVGSRQINDTTNKEKIEKKEQAESVTVSETHVEVKGLKNFKENALKNDYSKRSVEHDSEGRNINRKREYDRGRNQFHNDQNEKRSRIRRENFEHDYEFNDNCPTEDQWYGKKAAFKSYEWNQNQYQETSGSTHDDYFGSQSSERGTWKSYQDSCPSGYNENSYDTGESKEVWKRSQDGFKERRHASLLQGFKNHPSNENFSTRKENLIMYDYGHRSLSSSLPQRDNPVTSAFHLGQVETIDYGHGQANIQKEVIEYGHERADMPWSQSQYRTYNLQDGIEGSFNAPVDGLKRREKIESYGWEKKERSLESYEQARRPDAYECKDRYSRENVRSLELDDGIAFTQYDTKVNSSDDKVREITDKRCDIKVDTVLIEDLLNMPNRKNRASRIIVIIRGPPGSGKTFVAKLIKEKEIDNGGSAPRMLCIDDYFMTEVEKSEKDPETGKRIKKKVIEYEYDKAMDEVYQENLVKVFKKTIDNGFFPFIIVDAVNNKCSQFEEIWNYAKQHGFQVYIAELDMDAALCQKRNIHGRSVEDITQIIKKWEPTPKHYLRVDVRSLLQDAAISEVEMEDFIEQKGKDKAPERSKSKENDPNTGMVISRWERMEATEDKLDKLDGLRNMKKRLSQPQSIEGYLQLPDDYELRNSLPGIKRVRWADVEERKIQDRRRALGFVVGQTDWDKIVDPNHAEKALARTKYI